MATDTSIPARYARAISAYRFGDLRAAVGQIDALITAMPNYPYFYELKGQALLEGGHPAEAIAPLRHAVELAPNPALIKITLAQALIATNNAKMAEEAVPLLRAAIAKEPESGDGSFSAPPGKVCRFDDAPDVAERTTRVLLGMLDRYPERPDAANFDGLRPDLEIHAEPPEREGYLR